MRNNNLEFTDTALVVELLGLDKIWSLKGCIDIPWEHVRGATHDPGMKNEPKGFRFPGLRMGEKLAGTFHSNGEKLFWNVSGFENTVVIELKDEEFDRLVLTVDDPVTAVERINGLASAK
ncbi:MULTISPECIES: hypothetical protein [Corynebacterium]|uniref:Bacterial Pleckstrin homology domain-containing protein n=1 Tax=Corynebacterium pseudogenitalium TaxID=38303 RepID=A0ABD4TU94_9CORY|nr:MULTISPECIES: hypothetical protein [Corynebacterium]MCQ4610150.1 hypothetical protein [Corynebacterium sp. CCUG 61414]MCQ4615104.1 hypothetical protein [Corynebacterium pseudogenitalium]MDK8364224.1 hypothetical protein [Corynebacterium sp. UMB10119B]